MASIKSLGIQAPSAIAHMVGEGLLRYDPPPSAYTWKRFPIRDEGCRYDDEELLITKTAVAWSRGRVLQKVFRFEAENEPVRDAIFAYFNDDSYNNKPSTPFKQPAYDSSSFSPSLPIRKRPQNTNPAEQTKYRASMWSNVERGSTSTPSSSGNNDRALVILLQHQIHVISLTGSTHLIPLTFPIAAIMPLPSGVAIQRETSEDSSFARSQSLPAVPQNSFAMSQLAKSMTKPSQSPDQQPSPAIQKLIDNVFSQNSNHHSSPLVSHYFLRDPIADIEPLGESLSPDLKHAWDASNYGSRKLDQNERFIYVSPWDEISRDTKTTYGHSLIFAVTVNCVTGHYSVWMFSEQRQASRRKRSQDHLVTSKDRYRASFGPGTGATTPIARKSTAPRESLGKIRESIHDRSAVHDETDIASQLDPAFENPGVPSRSSRRISSLIARSEMHAGRDNTNAADLASGTSHIGGSKRGPSFGNRSSRKSFSSFGMERLRTDSTPRTGLERLPNTNDNDDDDETMADSDEQLQDTPMGDSAMPSAAHIRRLVVSRIFSIRADSLREPQRTYQSILTSHKVFTFFPDSTNIPENGSFNLALCIMSKHDSNFHVFDFTIAQNRDARLPSPPQRIRFKPKLNRAFNLPQIFDACIIEDSQYSRILIVRNPGDNKTELLLWSPWSRDLRIRLPTRTLTTDPLHIESEYDRQRRHDEGFRRVFCDGPDEVRSIQGGALSGQFGILDSELKCHQLKIHLSPVNKLVSYAIMICERVIPLEPEQSQPLIRAWWDVMSFVMKRLGKASDLEWRAFLVTILSLYVPFLERSNEAKPARTKRRGALMRSSSGANIELEHVEEAMAAESVIGTSAPPWLLHDTWAWMLEEKIPVGYKSPSQTKPRKSGSSIDSSTLSLMRKRSLIEECVDLAFSFSTSDAGKAALGGSGYLPTAKHVSTGQKAQTLKNVLIALHLLREELKLDIMSASRVHAMTPLLAQLGTWLEWDIWSCRSTSLYMAESADMHRWTFDHSKMRIARDVLQPFHPPSIMQHVEDVCNGMPGQPFLTLVDISGHQRSRTGSTKYSMPRTALLLELLPFQDSGPSSFIRIMGDSRLDAQILETLPEGVLAPLRSVIVSCQVNPGGSLPPKLLELIDRPDLNILRHPELASLPRAKPLGNTQHEATRDYSSICRSAVEAEATSGHEGQAEEDRSLITKLLFGNDQRFGEAARILHPLKHALAKCVPEPDWTDTELLEAQQDLAKIVASRTLSVSPGRAMLYYNARFPLLTEKFPIHGFSLGCLMIPSNTIVTADRNIYTEERVSWAFFHAGVEAGLSISKDAKGIDTSWISYNKPIDLGNRHAGFLLALGLNGHLRSIAKWVAFKYLTPKHTMTSIGLLLGLASSYMGTMDTLITRLLSVHVTRMLPVGAAEMNLSPLTQTTGIMGIGLLYCNSQHRRMSEIMLSEIESTEQDDIINPLENLRDEGYRLAAGFALGYINLGQGKNLQSMRDMHVVERLLSLATATKLVDLVHILDKATAAAVVALALVFMKTEDSSLAKKIDIPDTEPQFEYVRPDLFLLRTVARHLIMWKSIKPSFAWIKEQLPASYRNHYKLNRSVELHSLQLPLFNIIAGLCFSIALKFAGSAREDVRNVLGHYLDCFVKIVSLPGGSYDEKLTRIGARNCQDVIALSAAAVMAGTGDVFLLKRFRVLHGRTDVETHYGSHLAAHQAIGVLFLGGGTHTFNTSNLAVASLLCSFYPLFPTSVLDNRSHLQAFRHFWVFASEPRCLIARSIETRRPMSLDIIVTMRSGEELRRTAPCLLPELDLISCISSNDARFWPISLDFANNPQHLKAFRQHQSLYVSHRGAYNQGLSVFSATMRALNERQMSFQRRRESFEWVFSLPTLANLDHAARSLVLPMDESGNGNNLAALLLSGRRGTAVDDRLTLEHDCLHSRRAERLWSLRVLFAWEDKMRRVGSSEVLWLGTEVIDMLRAKLALLVRREMSPIAS